MTRPKRPCYACSARAEHDSLSAQVPESRFYQSLLPLVSTDIVFFDNVPFNTPKDYIYISCNCDQEGCATVCNTPYASAPSGAYLAVGNKPYSIFLLDPYPSSSITDRLFNSPTDVSAPGLGVFKPQLFQGIRGWDGFKQVPPVNLKDFMAECPTKDVCETSGPFQPLFRGKAQKVGTGKDNAKVSLDGKVALSGPIDLSVAALFLRQVLTEAGGDGELVHDGGGARFLPVQLTPRPGRKVEEVVFQTVPGTRPIIKVEVKNRHPETGEMEVKVEVERATIPQPEDCRSGRGALLRMRFILDDQVNEPLAVNVEQPWRCLKGQLATP